MKMRELMQMIEKIRNIKNRKKLSAKRKASDKTRSKISNLDNSYSSM